MELYFITNSIPDRNKKKKLQDNSEEKNLKGKELPNSLNRTE